MKVLRKFAHGLVLVGALNWGLIGLFQMNLVAKLLGEMTMLSRLVYLLVGISALVILLSRCNCKGCSGAKCCQKD